ncbi:MAG: DNA polymerase III subunit beta [Acidimicrobiales bacterium]
MKLRCERDSLVDALALAGRASSGRALPSALGGVKLDLRADTLHVTGTDQDLTIVTTVKVAGMEDGVVVVPSRLLADIARALPAGAVMIEGDEDEVRVSGGRSEFLLRPYRVADFPRVGVVSGPGVSLAATGLAEGLRQVVRAASSEEARPVLTGVLLAAEADGLRLVATDSYRLAVKDIPGAKALLEEGQHVLVPSRALAELQRLLAHDVSEVEVHVAPRDMAFCVDHVQLVTRLIDGEFPPYRQLIPFNYPNKLSVPRAAFLDAIKRVRLVARDATTPARVLLRDGSIQLNVVTNDWGQATEEVEASYEGAEMAIAFNPQYLADGVEAIPGDEVVLEALDSLKPVTLKPSGSADYVYLLMPVRVS